MAITREIMERDPRVDPRQYDLLLHLDGTFRQVRTWRHGVSFWQRVGGRSWTLEKLTMEEWREWAKNAEVLHASE